MLQGESDAEGDRMAQEQTKRQGGNDPDDDGAGADAAGQERREKLATETDDILDEIDDVLESNAEDFVRSYVQKGGQ
jgi:ubiquitin-like protein Pup